MKEYAPDHFPELRDAYAREGKTVLGYYAWEDHNHTGLPKLDVNWVWTALTNGDENHA